MGFYLGGFYQAQENKYRNEAKSFEINLSKEIQKDRQSRKDNEQRTVKFVDEKIFQFKLEFSFT